MYVEVCRAEFTFKKNRDRYYNIYMYMYVAKQLF